MEENNEEVVVEVQDKTTDSKVQNDRKGFNVTSLILGIIAIIAFYYPYICLPASIMAIIFSVAGKHDAGKGMGTAGLVLGIVSLVLMVVVYIFVFGLAALIVLAEY